MIKLSDAARQTLAEYFQDKKPSPIRVKVAPGACMGPKLTLGLGQRRGFDEAVEIDGLTFVMHKALWSQVGRMTIDMKRNGFTVATERRPDVDCSGGGDCEACAARQGQGFPG